MKKTLYAAAGKAALAAAAAAQSTANTKGPRTCRLTVSIVRSSYLKHRLQMNRTPTPSATCLGKKCSPTLVSRTS